MLYPEKIDDYNQGNGLAKKIKTFIETNEIRPKIF